MLRCSAESCNPSPGAQPRRHPLVNKSRRTSAADSSATKLGPSHSTTRVHARPVSGDLAPRRRGGDFRAQGIGGAPEMGERRVASQPERGDWGART
eukprot:2590513-Pyramimonas_sp.AAC.1